MAETLSTGLYAPEVWEDLSQAEFTNRAIVLNAATQADTLVGAPGDTVVFPKWSTLSDLDDLSEGVPMDTEALTQRSSRATIKEAGKAVEITDTASLNGLGNAQDEAIRQFGVLSARKLDADLISAATEIITGGITYADGTAAGNSAPLAFSTDAGVGLTWNTIVDSTTLFGDDFELSDVFGLFIRSDQKAAMLKDDQFIQAAQTTNGNAVINRGLIGQVGGMNVFVTDRLATGKAVIVKRNSLGVLYKRRPIVEQDRDILKRTNVVTTNLHYAVKRLNDKGIVDITLTPAV